MPTSPARAPRSFRSQVAATRQLWSYALRTLRLVAASSPAPVVLLVLFTLLGALAPILVAFAGKRIIDGVVAADEALTVRWVLLELASVLALGLGLRGLGLVRSILGARLGTDVNVQILSKAQSLDLEFFENAEFYDKLTRARREASSRPVALVSDAFQVVQNALTLAGYAAVLTRFSGWLVLGLLIATV
ncbi:MAG TPA: hypothetical protein VFS67_10630, partial [Polyangiaceae bacterium]|nr:hypothetical protein [Polyangiaceae bacterium]